MNLLFVTSPGPSSLLIRAFEGGLSSHVGILHDNTVIDTTFRHGVRSWSIEEFNKHHTIITNISFKVPNEELGIQFLKAQIGKPYDWTALAGFLMWRDWSETDSWYCSELAIAMAIASGKRLIDKPNRIGVRMAHELAYAWSQGIL